MSRPPSHARGRAALSLLCGLALLVAGCTPEDQPAAAAGETPSPYGDCASLTKMPSASPAAAPPAAAPPSAAPALSGPPAVPADLPDLELPCFTGGAPVRLDQLRGPLVLNLWATWCAPCREELPVMQELAARTAGRVHVVGVDTGDSREAAASFGADLGVTIPTLYDRDRRLLAAVGRNALPVTVFVDAAGRRTVHPLPMDAAELARRLRETTGVAVTG